MGFILNQIVSATTLQTDADINLLNMWVYGRPERTQKHYLSIARQFLAFTGQSIQELGLMHIQHYGASISHLAPATQANRLCTVKSLLAFAQGIGYITINPAMAIQMPRIKNILAERIIAEEDVHRMIEAERHTRNRLILRLLYIAGIRREELCGLRVKDMRKHGKAGKLTVFGKGGKTRTVPITASLWIDLSEYVPADRNAPLFRSTRGAISGTTVWRIVKRAAKRAGLPENVTTHALRHSHASHALDHGCPVHVLQAVLGHSNLNTTSKYVHVQSDDTSAAYLQDV